jgi:hypothetical protein
MHRIYMVLANPMYKWCACPYYTLTHLNVKIAQLV